MRLLAACLILALCAAPAGALELRRPASSLTLQKEGGAVTLERPQGPHLKLERTEPASPGQLEAQKALAADALARGWEYLNLGNLKGAAREFEAARKGPTADVAQEALLGMAYLELREGRRLQARDMLATLAAAGFRPEETLPALLELLDGLGDRPRYEYYSAWLPEDRREALRKMRQGKGLRVGLKELPAGADRARVRAVLAEHGEEVAACKDAWAVFDAARMLVRAGDDARDVLNALLRCPGRDEDLRLAVFDELSRRLPVEEAVALFDRHTAGLSAKGVRRIQDRIAGLYKAELGHMAENDPGRAALARRILARNPSDVDARLILGWAALNRSEADTATAEQDLAEARDVFRGLHEQYPQSEEYLAGLVFALARSGMPAEVARTVEASPAKPEGRIWEAYRLALLDLAGRALSERRFKEVLDRLAPLEARGVSDAQVLELEAWAYKGLGDNERSLALFETIYGEEAQPQAAAQILAIMESSGREAQAVARAKIMAAEAGPEVRREAGSLLARLRLPEQAAIADPDPTAPYAGQASATAGAGAELRYRTGDAGTSSLTALSLPAKYSTSSFSGDRFTFALTPEYLSTGQGPANPYLGSYYRSSNGGPQRQSPLDQLWTISPSLSWKREGLTTFEAGLGSTPLGGPTAPLPLFNLSAKSQDWRLGAFQRPVDETMLSYVGQRDPYSGRAWGRVVALGAEAGVTLHPAQDWFISLDGATAYLYGQSVAGNWKVEASASAGRHFDLGWGLLDAGLFALWRHFDKDLNHFTFGHGGYYSPQFMFTVGPFLHLGSQPNLTYAYDLTGALGYFKDRSDPQAKYPLFSGAAWGLSSPALAEAGGTYPGSASEKLSLRFKGSAEKLLTPRIALGGMFEVNNSASYTELRSLIQLRYFFEDRQTLSGGK